MKPATNGLGWCVEAYFHETGWEPITKAFATPQLADHWRESVISSNAPLRTYEALEQTK